MFNTGYNSTSNMGFGNRFKLNQVYSPALSSIDLTPGMVQLSQPMPTAAGGAAPGMASTANGIGGGAVMPGAAGSMSPGNIPMASPQASSPPINPAATSWPGMNNPMQQQMPAGGGGMSPSAMAQLAQLGGGLLGSSQPQGAAPAPPAAPQHSVTGQNGALQRLLSMYGIQGGLLGG